MILPSLDLSGEFTFPSLPKHKPYLYSNGRALLISSRQVVVVHGAIISRKLVYNENIVTATYTRFIRNSTLDTSDALVVCLQNAAHIYYPDGDSYVVSFPFLLRNAFPFDSGLLLEKDHDNPATTASAISNYRFLTLVDPIGDLRVVTTSSTSVVNAQETLVYFPPKGLNKTTSLTVTFNSRQRTIGIYHVKASSRKNIMSTNIRKRRNTSVSTPNPSKILDDEYLDLGPGPTFHASNSSFSMNMEKKRTSTLLSGVSSVARIGSEASISELGKSTLALAALELGALRKDMILTKIDTVSTRARRLHLAVSGLHHEDKQAVVISDRASKETQVYMYKQLVNQIPQFDASCSVQCLHAVPLDHPSFPGWLLVLADEKTLYLFNPFLDLKTPPIPLHSKFPPITYIFSTCENMVALRDTTDIFKTHLISLVLEPQTPLVSTCLKSWKYLSGSKIREHMWVIWRSALMLDPVKDEWNAFVITLLSMIYPFDEFENAQYINNEITLLLDSAKKVRDYFNIDYSFQDLLPYIVVSMHLIYEETKLHVLSKFSLNKLGTLLTQLTVWMGWLEQWTTFYLIDHKSIDKSVRLLLVVLIYVPPSLYDSLISLVEGKRARYLKFSHLVEESDDVNMMVTPRSHMVYHLFELLCNPHVIPSQVVNAMCEFGISATDLDTYPVGISHPLKECLLASQENPSFDWNENYLELIGRRDLMLLLQLDSRLTLSNEVELGTSQSVRDANSIIASTFTKGDNLVAWDGESEADLIRITKLIFDKDRRYYEITSLLHQSRTQNVTLTVEEGTSEYDSTLMKRELAALVALRTLMIPVGRAALFYAGRIPLLTETFPIPKFNLNTLIAPSMTTIVLSEGTVPSKVMEWGHFHNGVSSGLSISPFTKGISGSWVIFNKPAENNAQHAGFLLGLGLNGHLKKLEEWHIYNYLGPKHPLTSVGLLIGMAASLRGTMDNKLTKVLSVHAVALLPQGANDLNVPILVQTAGLIGIGLLYLETQHRRMSEILLSQIGGSSSHIENEEELEGYRQAAGIALGLINLGKGDDLRGLNDTHVVDRLLAFATSMRDSHPVFELDKSGSGAILALGFIYLKLENATIAAKLLIPESEQLLDYIRPDLLLLRCLAKNLIMWRLIGNSTHWVESEIPEVLRKKYNINNLVALDSEQISYFNILGGACLSIAIKHASSQDLNARRTLLHYLDLFMDISTMPAVNYDQKIGYNCAAQIQNLLALCLSVVMAGSGDLEVFRRLRLIHGRINNNVHYGSHMAVNMALGILFLGGSQYAFKDSNFAIASLITSLYPVFPNEEYDHEVHLQVLRHFWALAVEPRCLVVREVKNGNPIKVSLRINYRDGTLEKTTAPHLLATMKRIASIEVISDEYFKVKIDFLAPTGYLEQFKKSLTIYVLKKLNYELLRASVSSLLKSESRALEEEAKDEVGRDIKALLQLEIAKPLSTFEKQVYLHESIRTHTSFDSNEINSGLSIFNIIDSKIELSMMAANPQSVDDLRNLKLLFAFCDHYVGTQLHYLTSDFIERLRQTLWELTKSK